MNLKNLELEYETKLKIQGRKVAELADAIHHARMHECELRGAYVAIKTLNEAPAENVNEVAAEAQK